MSELERFAAFNSGLASLLQSGIPLDGALESLARELGRGRFRRAVERAEAGVRAGKSLSEAVAEERAFPSCYAALVRAGEEGGRLPDLLIQAAREARASAEMAARLQAALVYPALVVTCTFGVTCFFGWYVVGHFEEMFRDMNILGGLPLLTIMALRVGYAMPWIGAIGLGVMAGLGLYAYLARAFGLRLPSLAVLGWLPPVKAGEIARFAGSLSLLTSSGVKLPQALALVGEMMRVPAFRAASLRAARRVREGTGLALALREERVFPYFFTWAVGAEEGGQGFDAILREMSRLYQERARRSGELLGLLLAPAAIVAAGLVVGLFVLATYLPLVQIMRSF